MSSRNNRGQEKWPAYAGTNEGEPGQRGEIAEAELIDRAKQQDAAAFERLYKSYSRRVYALCLRMLGNTGEAEDLTQEAFLQVFRKIHTFRGESAFSTWLHRLAVNVVLMRLRRKAPQETLLEDCIEARGAGRPFSKEARDPGRSLNGSIERLCLEAAIEQLPACYKLVFELHDVQGYRHKEIAKIMECSVGTSKAQLHRAHRRLRELLGEKLGLAWLTPAGASELAQTAR